MTDTLKDLLDTYAKSIRDCEQFLAAGAVADDVYQHAAYAGVAARSAIEAHWAELEVDRARMDFLESADEKIQQLRDAWLAYADNAFVSDGHTKACKRWIHPMNSCTCGLRELERAITLLIRPEIADGSGSPTAPQEKP